MADTKTSALAAIDSVATGDLFPVVDDPSGTPVTKKATAEQVLAFGDARTATMSNKTFVAPVLGAATATSVAASSYVSVGATPASAGAIRITTDEGVYGRDGVGNNYRLVHWDGTSKSLNIGESGGLSNVVVYGESGITLAIASTTMAILDSSGLKLGSGNRVLLEVPALAAARTFAVPLLTGNDTMVGEAHTQTLSNKTFVAPVLGAATATSVAASSFLSAGANPPSSSAIRLGNATSLIRTRNNGNTADLDVIGTTGASDSLTVWGNGAAYGHLILQIGSGAQCFMSTTSVNVLAAANDGVQIGAAASATTFGSGAGVLGIENARTNPSANPSTGGVLYADAGAGKWRGSSGTVTTFGPADPHCPTCGRDFATEHKNDDMGEHFAVCLPCLIDAVVALGADASKFSIANKRASTKAQWDAHHAAAKARAAEAKAAEAERRAEEPSPDA